MVKRNPHIAKLHSSYLFPEIVRRKEQFLQTHPNARLISLGIGDTTEPLPPLISEHLSLSASALSTHDGYRGYGPEEGYKELREKISAVLYNNKFGSDEIFISDGTNSDIGRLHTLFGSSATFAVQDPSYPAYVDTGVMTGLSDPYHLTTQRYAGITYLHCSPENDFFPDLSTVKPVDIIYYCSPNNPTGAVSTKEQLARLVAFAKKNRSIIVFDTAYASYIRDPHLPRSIYEIDGAEEVAIELGSFSKMAGFTGIRLAWSVVPKALTYDSGGSINRDWKRVHTTFFNGASCLAQQGGLAVLTPEGLESINAQIELYMANAALLRKTALATGLDVYGGLHAPYIWVRMPGYTSWEAFDALLHNCHIVTAPGSGFGPAGEGFIRLSAFGKPETIREAAGRLAMIPSKEF